MIEEVQISLATLIKYVCQQLLEARSQRDLTRVPNLIEGLELMREAAWYHRDEVFAKLLDDLIGAAQDTMVGVEWKSTIPSMQQIDALFSG